MKKKFAILALSAIAVCCLSAACADKTDGKTNDNAEKSEKITYTGEMIYNSFDTVADMYRVNQFYTWDYKPLGKLSIADKIEKDGIIGDGALKVYYKRGAFTEISARFDASALAGLPVDDIGETSVRAYNDSDEVKTIKISLMRAKNEIVDIEGGEFELPPRVWTTCGVTVDPIILDYFKDDLAGLCVRFSSTNESTYYLDEWKIKFGKVYTDETKELLKKVDELKELIDDVDVTAVTPSDREKLENLVEKYNELPQAYRATVSNYDLLESATGKYFEVKNAAEEDSGRITALAFGEVLGVTQITPFDGGSVSYTSEQTFNGESGSVKIAFDGSASDWINIGLKPSKPDGFDELRIRVKIVSDNRMAITANWIDSAKIKMYDENGSLIADGTNIVPKDALGKWIEISITSLTELSQFNVTSIGEMSAGNPALPAKGEVYFGSVIAVCNFAKVNEQIEALPNYSKDYSLENREKVKAARAAYDALSGYSKRRVSSVDRLAEIEASIWKEGMASLPSSADEITAFDEDYYAAATSLRKAYDLLAKETAEKVTAEVRLLGEIEAKLKTFAADRFRSILDALTVKTSLYSADEVSNILSAAEIYADLDETQKSSITQAYTDKLNALTGAVSNYYTLSDLGGGFDGNLDNLGAWVALRANLKNKNGGVIVFKASGISSGDGAFYFSLFHDASVNAGNAADGIYAFLRNNQKILYPALGNFEIGFNDGKSIDKSKTYTFYLTYSVESDLSAITLGVKIADAIGVSVAEGEKRVTETSFASFNGGSAISVKNWLENHDERYSLLISTGASNGVTLSSAW